MKQGTACRAAGIPAKFFGNSVTSITYIDGMFKSIGMNMMGNFFGLMKNELLYVNHYNSIEEFEKELKQYIWWYNNKRIKLRLKGMSPVQYRAQYYKDLNKNI